MKKLQPVRGTKDISDDEKYLRGYFLIPQDQGPPGLLITLEIFFG